MAGAFAASGFASCLLWIWLGNARWAATAALLTLVSFVPLALYVVIRTPEMVPRMREHYRVRGVEITDGDQP